MKDAVIVKTVWTMVEVLVAVSVAVSVVAMVSNNASARSRRP